MGFLQCEKNRKEFERIFKLVMKLNVARLIAKNETFLGNLQTMWLS